MRRRWLAALFACLAGSSACAWDAHEGEPLPTRYGEVVATESGEDAYDLAVEGRSVGTLRGLAGRWLNAAYLNLVSGEGVDYVLVDLLVPGLYCTHEFAVLELSAGQPPRLGANFGECHDLEWARVVDGRLVVLLQKSIVYVEGEPEPEPEYTAFLWRNGYSEELAGPCTDIDPLEAGPLALLDRLRDGATAANASAFGLGVEPCAGFVRDEDLPGLLARLDSQRPALAVTSAKSSKLSRGLSTEGHEAAFLVESWRQGVYPPALDSRDWTGHLTEEQRAELARIGADARDP